MVVITHQARESGVRRALDREAGLDCVWQRPVALTVVDEHEEF